MKTTVCAFALAMAAVAPAIADDFTYLSGGLLYHNGKDMVEKKININQSSAPEFVAPKKNAMGFYLNGSIGAGDYLFFEGRLQHSSIGQEDLIGVGAHYPVTQWAEVYGLAGITQKRFVIVVGEETVTLNSDSLELNCKDTFQPTIEIGTKVHFNEVIGIRFSYRYAQFNPSIIKNEESSHKHLHNIHLGGYYEVTDSCAVEAGYNFTRFLKDVNEHKVTAGIRYSF